MFNEGSGPVRVLGALLFLVEGGGGGGGGGMDSVFQQTLMIKGTDSGGARYGPVPEVWEPRTLNPKPQTPNLKPQTLNPRL